MKNFVFVKCVEWPPLSPDVNPLDYFFWDLLKTKVNQGRAGEPFSLEEELKRRIKAVWKNCATDLKPLQKAIISLSLDYEKSQKTRDIVSKRYLVD